MERYEIHVLHYIIIIIIVKRNTAHAEGNYNVNVSYRINKQPIKESDTTRSERAE